MSFGSRAGLTLPILNQMAIPIYTAQSREEVETGGQFLFHDFIHQQFQAQNLSDEEIVSHDPGPAGDVGPQLRFRIASPVVASTPEGYSNENFFRIGTNIREIADQFAHSKERPLIKRQADQVDLSSINQDSFFQLLSVIFRDGINKYRIVALFYFCSDVLIRCVKQKLTEQGINLFAWSMNFLVQRVCRWVYDHGGWERVFSKFYKILFNVSAVVAFGVIISCGLVWMRKNL